MFDREDTKEKEHEQSAESNDERAESLDSSNASVQNDGSAGKDLRKKEARLRATFEKKTMVNLVSIVPQYEYIY